VNLLTYSEQFDNAAWTKQNLLAFGSGSIVNATTAPDGTVTADKITPDTSATNHRVEQSTTWAATSYTLVVYAKPAGYNYVRIRSFASAVGAFSQVFNLQNGTVGTAGSGTRTATISAAPNGFYLCTMTFSIASATTGNILIEAQSTDSESGFAGDGTSGIYIWGADLRVTNDGVGIPAYQRVAAATDYDTSGFPLYLSADGTDDSMATSAIDFSATDKMSVFAGVRKLSDAAYGTVAELSASVDTNNGTFALFNPSSPAWQTRLHGNSAATNYAQSTPATYTAPISNIVTLVYDLAGANLNAKLTPRINGVVNQATNIDSGTGAGTGNFGNWPLYIGRRGGTTLPYNGRIYGLVIRGAASTDAQISAMEKWMAAKTGITI
jgi:hypothetical protein